jgi:hypothetical protein
VYRLLYWLEIPANTEPGIAKLIVLIRCLDGFIVERIRILLDGDDPLPAVHRGPTMAGAFSPGKVNPIRAQPVLVLHYNAIVSAPVGSLHL